MIDDEEPKKGKKDAANEALIPIGEGYDSEDEEDSEESGEDEEE